MEKNGTITLTEKDMEAYLKGKVSERLFSTWGLTYAGLYEIIRSSNYKLIKRTDNDS